MPAGRPLKFENKEIIQELVDKYFLGCKTRRLFFDGTIEICDDNEIQAMEFTEDQHPTISGLALALDTSRKVLIDYEDKEEFSYTIKKAKQRVESYNEQRLHSNNVAGVIFNLKNNFEWKDKSEIDTTNRVEIIEYKKDFDDDIPNTS